MLILNTKRANVNRFAFWIVHLSRVRQFVHIENGAAGKILLLKLFQFFVF